MSTLILVESHFGNTWRIGEAIAAARPDSTLIRVDEAPQRIDEHVDLLILGAPTHAFTLPTAESRASASQRTTVGARRAEKNGFHVGTTGLREWIATASIPRSTDVVTFDTCVKGAGPLFGRASKKAVKALIAHGVTARVGETFWVTNSDELRAGEIDRATMWAAQQ